MGTSTSPAIHTSHLPTYFPLTILKHHFFKTTCAGVGEEDKRSRVMEITSKLTPEEVVAKVMMAARDPDLDTAAAAVATNNTAELRLA